MIKGRMRRSVLESEGLDLLGRRGEVNLFLGIVKEEFFSILKIWKMMMK